jgi:hypothetical protein
VDEKKSAQRAKLKKKREDKAALKKRLSNIKRRGEKLERAAAKNYEKKKKDRATAKKNSEKRGAVLTRHQSPDHNILATYLHFGTDEIPSREFFGVRPNRLDELQRLADRLIQITED